MTRTHTLKLPVPTEHHEQRLLIDWCATQKVPHPELQYIFAVPNGARTSMSVAKRLKAEGLRKGYPDLGLDVARGGFHGLRLELKRLNGVPSAVSPEQRAWGEWLMTQGYSWHVCFGWEAARYRLLQYLALPPTGGTSAPLTDVV